MYVSQLLRKFNRNSLVEIVDYKFRRLYYGTVQEMTKDDCKMLRKMSVEEVNPFDALITIIYFVPAVQIRLSGTIGDE